MLHSTTSLLLLDLRAIGCGDFGAAELAPSIALLPRLRVLDLSQNPFGDAGAELFAESIQQLSELELVCVQNDVMGAAGRAALTRAFAALPALKVGHLDDCNPQCPHVKPEQPLRWPII